jgi:hypothetical protein
VRVSAYSPTPAGRIVSFTVHPGEIVIPGRELAQVEDVQILNQLAEIETDMLNARSDADSLDNASRDPSTAPDKQKDLQSQARQQRATERNKANQLNRLRANYGAGQGRFSVRAPAFTPDDVAKLSKLEWTVLNSNFRQELTDRTVQPNEPILRLGAKSGPWEIDMKIPQKHIGQVLEAFVLEKTDRLDVDFLLRSDPTRKFKGVLLLDKIAGEADPSHDDTGEAEPVVTAKVRIDGEDIPEEFRVPRELLVSGTEVHAKIRCGKRAMGYSLFYGVWEFFYDKVVFFF